MRIRSVVFSRLTRSCRTLGAGLALGALGLGLPGIALGQAFNDPFAQSAAPTPASTPGAFSNPFASSSAPSGLGAPKTDLAAPAAAAQPPVPAAAQPPVPTAAQPPSAAAAGPSADPFSAVFGSGVTASVKEAGAPAPTPQPSQAAPAPAASVAGTGEGLTPQDRLILQMRQAIADRRYDEIKGMAEEYALQFPDNPRGEFFLNLARIRRDTEDKRRETERGGFLRLAQMGSRGAAGVQVASAKPLTGGEGGPTAASQPAAGAAAVAAPTPFETAMTGAGAARAASLPAAAGSKAGAAPGPSEEAFEEPGPWGTYVKSYAIPAAFGGGGLIVLATVLAFLWRRKKAGEPDIFQEAMASAAQEAEPTALGGAAESEAETIFEVAPGEEISGGALFDEMQPDLETESLGAETAAIEPGTGPTQLVEPFGEEAFPELEMIEEAPIDGSPTPTGTLPDEGEGTRAAAPPPSGMLDVELGLFEEPSADTETREKTVGRGAARPPAPSAELDVEGETGPSKETTPAPTSEIDQLLSFIPAEGEPTPTPTAQSVPAFSLPSAPEESTGGLSLDDLELPEEPALPGPGAGDSTPGLGIELAEPSGREKESTGGLELSDLIIPDETTPPKEPAGAGTQTGASFGVDSMAWHQEDLEPTPTVEAPLPMPPAPPARETTRTDSFNRRFEEVMFEPAPEVETRDGAERRGTEDSTDGSASTDQASAPTPPPSGFAPPFDFAPPDETRPSEFFPPPDVDFGELDDTGIPGPPPGPPDAVEEHTQEETAPSPPDSDTAAGGAEPKNR